MKQLNEIIFQGIPLSKGISIGPLFVYDSQKITLKPIKIGFDGIENEIANFKKTLKEVGKELQVIKKNVQEKVGDQKAQILDVQMMILQDPELHSKVENQIRTQRIKWDFVFSEIMGEYQDSLLGINDSILRERAYDVHDVKMRVLKRSSSLIPKDTKFRDGAIVVAEMLTPTELIDVFKAKASGFVTDFGGINSHLAIIANALSFGGISGSGRLFNKLLGFANSIAILDGRVGNLIVNPSAETLKNYQSEKVKFKRSKTRFTNQRLEEATTKGGISITLSLNLSLESDFHLAKKFNSQGVGLFRTEHLLLDKADYPLEKTQTEIYRKLSKSCFPHSARIRTFDIGGEKLVGNFNLPTQINPSLGWRGIRISLEETEVFKTQIKAILRANTLGNLEILLPMVSKISEFRKAKGLIEEAKEELRKQKKKFNSEIKIGVMIEIPSAALTADIFAKEVDFMSIGTNDLTQYTLAVDRSNNLVSDFYTPTHIGVLRLLKYVLDSARKEKIPVNICGEMAGNILTIPLLIGMGFGGLSVSPSSIPTVREVINRTNLKSLKKLSVQALSASENAEVKKLLTDFKEKNFKEEFGF